MATAQAQSTIPTGIWKSDPVHSSASFAVRHIVGTFRGGLSDFAGELSDEGGEPRISGVGKVDSIQIDQEDLRAHVLAPDFFDAERYPEIGFYSSGIRREGDELVVDGELSLKGTTKAVEARGKINGPVAVPRPDEGVSERIGIELETKVDRHDFGLDWNAELPGGGTVLGDEVTITVHLELQKEE